MGSYSHLRVGRLNIDWSKNSLTDHSDLYSQFDKKLVTYFYADNYQEDKPGYSRKLKKCKVALELLGFGETNIVERIKLSLHESELALSFAQFKELVLSIDVRKSVWDGEVDDFPSNSELSTKIIQIVKSDQKYGEFHSRIYELGDLFDSFDAYTILGIFLLFGIWLDEEVVWEYYDLVDGGWIEESEVDLSLRQRSRFLLITEGSSDSLILKKALSWIMPDVADFFDFIDMEKNYPFTGVGSLVNFYHGLLKIGPIQNILFIFDNDTAGNAALKRCAADPNSNIKLMKLPQYDGFLGFRTLGPTGVSFEDVNDRAVAIEMFLDLEYGSSQEPEIRWTSYDESLQSYQGALLNKDIYVKRFVKAEKNRDVEYNLGKLSFLLDRILDKAKEF